MNKPSSVAAVLALTLAGSSCWLPDAFAQQTNKGPAIVTIVVPPDAARPCAFFQLQGVLQADPAFPNQPWFAIPMTNVGFHEEYALLLSAAFNNHPILAISFTGQAACGYVQVDALQASFP